MSTASITDSQLFRSVLLALVSLTLGTLGTMAFVPRLTEDRVASIARTATREVITTESIGAVAVEERLNAKVDAIALDVRENQDSIEQLQDDITDVKAILARIEGAR